MVRRHGIITLQADATRSTPEIEEAKARYNSVSLPILVIISPANPSEPIILRDIYNQETLLESLHKAVTKTRAAGNQLARDEASSGRAASN